jgi:hypothetical protein
MSAVHPAPLQLADLAAVMRPDWPREQLEGAIAAARQSWSWPRIFGEVARLLVDEDSSPRDLTVAARDPMTRTQPSPNYREWAQACREAVATVTGRAS